VQVAWTPSALELSGGFALRDAALLVTATGDSEARPETVNAASLQPAFAAIAPSLWAVRAGEQPLLPLSASAVLAPGDNVNFAVRFSRPPSATVALRASRLNALPPGHRQFVIVTDPAGTVLAKKLLSAKDDTIEFPVPAVGVAPEAPAPTFFGFIRLGVEHIWTGYDHLLFLFALLMVCRTFRSIVAIISCFTLAHSLTLALATLNIVNLPSRITEPAIAASIVFVGIENLVRRGAEPRGRWALTFAFGLIHGFGFASVLRDLGVGDHGQSIAVPLFTFNLGVELGQITIAVIVLPLIWKLRKSERFVHRGVPALSACVAIAGQYWLLQRTIFA